MILKASSLAQIGNVRHAFFTREGGISAGIYASLNGGIGSGDAPANVRENRARMASALGLSPERLLTAYQIHSAEAVIVDGPWSVSERPRADALVTSTPGLAIAITTADCGPILLADQHGGVIAAVHAGWRGALNGIVGAAVAAMERCGARRQKIVAAIGPLIRQPMYEVGPDLMAAFDRRFFTPARRADHALFDLAGYIASRLHGAGVAHVEDLGLCTYSDETRFFSYRRSVHRQEGDYGRHISAIALSS
jgi:purine-nucleoside/S-methyl-5'-thioadenosine phosphorylase / adenosine deaminase